MCMTGKPEVQQLLGTSLKTSRGTLKNRGERGVTEKAEENVGEEHI